MDGGINAMLLFKKERRHSYNSFKHVKTLCNKVFAL